MSFDRLEFSDGLRRIAFGVFKKIVLADALVGVMWGGQPIAHAQKVIHTAGDAWGRMGLYFLYCYLDFSALTDIAIGLGLLFGWRLIENFDKPFLARDLGDYWQRWHISLSGFCRYYVYLYVLSHTRRYFLGFLGTMVVMGLWHDLTINWLVWGIYHALGLYLFVVLRAALKGHRAMEVYEAPYFLPVRTVVTLAYVALGYAWVGTETWRDALHVWAVAFGIR